MSVRRSLLLPPGGTIAPGQYGDATNVAQFTVDALGRLVQAANVSITGGGTANRTLLCLASDRSYTSDTTLAVVDAGFEQTLANNKTYHMRWYGRLEFNVGSSGGFQFRLNGTAAPAFLQGVVHGIPYSSSTWANPWSADWNSATLTSNSVSNGSPGTAGQYWIDIDITVSMGGSGTGTINLEAAQATTNATASILVAGFTMVFEEVATV